MLKPKLLTSLKSYSKTLFLSDLRAGINVGIVALPLSIAFGVLSGLSPKEGLIAAIVAGLIAALLGGSRFQITGPTGASAIVIYGVLQQYGKSGLITCTILAGIFMTILGLAKLGNLIKFVPRPLTLGFTTSVAVIIFCSQIRDVLGLQVEMVPINLVDKFISYWQNIRSWNVGALLITLGTIFTISIWPLLLKKWAQKIPALFVVLILSAAITYFFKIPVETLGSRFGRLTLDIQFLKSAQFSFALIHEMMRPAFTIAVLGSMVSLMSAVVGDGMTQGHHRSNMELVAQGIANIASGLLGGMPAQGAVARTATNIKNGAQTPIAAAIHSLTLLLLVLVFGKAAQWIPTACLAGILVIIAFNMIDFYSLADLIRGTKSDAAILIVTFLLGIFTNLTISMEVGLSLSLFLFVNRMATVTKTQPFFEDSEAEDAPLLPAVPDGIEIYEVDGPLFFASALDFLQTMRLVSRKVKVQILYFRNTSVIDATGLHYLHLFHQECHNGNIHLIIAGLHTQPLKAVKRAGYFELFGRKNIYLKLDSAILRAEELLKNIPASAG